MLSLRASHSISQQPLPPSLHQSRGRSRQVSNVALTRQASEERNATRQRRSTLQSLERASCSSSSDIIFEKSMPLDTYPQAHHQTAVTAMREDLYSLTLPESQLSFTSPSPSSSSTTTRTPSPCTSGYSSSSNYYDSPQSPPRSLEDQVQDAYALDDIHLAKVLLLKLKGIEVTSDDDPRIAGVQDEDFDAYFLPPGGFMDAETEQKLLERQNAERERIRELRRVEKLQQTARMWERERWRLREMRRNKGLWTHMTSPVPQHRPSSSDDQSVPFIDTLTSMNGSLFPACKGEDIHRSRCAVRELQLLDILLETVTWREGERRQRSKGKEREKEHLSSGQVGTASPLPSLATSVTSSRSAWLPFKAPRLPTRYSWLKPDSSCAPRRNFPIHSSRATVLLSESPLHPCMVTTKPLVHIPPLSQPRPNSTPTTYVFKQMSRFMKLAKGFQNAYMNAASFSVISVDSLDDRYIGVNHGNTQSRVKAKPQKLRPAGYRVRSKDVSIFTHPTMTATGNVLEAEELTAQTTDIPLRVRHHPSQTLPQPRTVLPNPLPYELAFKPHAPIARSPYRHLAQDRVDDQSFTCQSRSQLCAYDYSTSTISCRVRIISNPVHLRLKALQRVIFSQGLAWEGCERPEWSESSMCSGRDKLLRVAFDGIGRSALSRDARIGVACN